MNTSRAPRAPSGAPSRESSSSESPRSCEVCPEPKNAASPDLVCGARALSSCSSPNIALAPPPPERPPPPIGRDGDDDEEEEEEIPEPPERVELMPSIQESPLENSADLFRSRLTYASQIHTSR